MILNLEKLRKDYKTIRKENFQISERLNTLIEITKIELKHEGDLSKAGKRMAISALASAINISIRTIMRWKSFYNNSGTQGLIIEKAAGRNPNEIQSSVQLLISNYRKNYRWGSEVIQAHLFHDHQVELSRFKIDRFIKKSGLLELYPVTTRKKKVKMKKKHTQKVKVENPGAHTQMDVKYQLHLLTNHQKCYVYNFMDHASNWSFKYAYSAFSALNTRNFMIRLLEICPFDIFRLQTDNGVEFTYKYISVSNDPVTHPLDLFCEANGIVHKLIPPGEKELQGLVERSHRQDDQELFSRIDPIHLQEFNKFLEEYWIWRNANRRFKKLNWKTPVQWLDGHMITAIILSFAIKNVSEGRGKFDNDNSAIITNENKIIDNCFSIKKQAA